ncbi:MAG: hypothetical protein MJB14_12955 [Spirochaetes bacterium]|nr:hypothetical protein [Spirochaetota bacterium]
MKKSYFTVRLLFCIINISFHLSAESLDDIVNQYFRYDKWAEAKIALEDYISVNSTDSKGLSYYAAALFQLKATDEAIMALRKAINYEDSTDKKGSYYYRLGAYYYDQQLTELALEMLNKATTYNTIIASPYYLKGLIYYEQGSMDDCLSNWKKYVHLTTNIEKKKKIEKLISLFETEILEAKIRQEEAERKRQELLDKLKKELEETDADTSTMKAEKEIDVEPTDEDFLDEELDF